MQKERGVEWRGIVRESHPVPLWQGEAEQVSGAWRGGSVD